MTTSLENSDANAESEKRKTERLARQLQIERAEFRHPSTKGVTLQCWRCRRLYDNCHPHYPCYCALCSHEMKEKVQLHPMKVIMQVELFVISWMLGNGKALSA